jgi:hypothetical protein
LAVHGWTRRRDVAARPAASPHRAISRRTTLTPASASIQAQLGCGSIPHPRSAVPLPALGSAWRRMRPGRGLLGCSRGKCALLPLERYVCTPAIGGVYKNATKPNNTQRDQTRVRVGSNNVQQRPMLPNVTQCLFKRPTLPNIAQTLPNNIPERSSMSNTRWVMLGNVGGRYKSFL